MNRRNLPLSERLRLIERDLWILRNAVDQNRKRIISLEIEADERAARSE